ncbi:unnamed protein product, partial [Laminaria digitata]
MLFPKLCTCRIHTDILMSHGADVSRERFIFVNQRVSRQGSTQCFQFSTHRLSVKLTALKSRLAGFECDEWYHPNEKKNELFGLLATACWPSAGLVWPRVFPV